MYIFLTRQPINLLIDRSPQGYLIILPVYYYGTSNKNFT